jgi:hypothetical protein
MKMSILLNCIKLKLFERSHKLVWCLRKKEATVAVEEAIIKILN